MFIEAKDDGGGDDNWTTGAISRAKLQSNQHHQQTNIQFFLQPGCPSCHPTNSVKALKGKALLDVMTFDMLLWENAEKFWVCVLIRGVEFLHVEFKYSVQQDDGWHVADNKAVWSRQASVMSSAVFVLDDNVC